MASGDNEFPYVHGHELAVRSLRMRQGLQVVLISGNVDKDLAGYGIRRDGLPFLAKPFEARTLVALVRMTLNAPPPSVERLTGGPPEKVLVGEGGMISGRLLSRDAGREGEGSGLVSTLFTSRPKLFAVWVYSGGMRSSGHFLRERNVRVPGRDPISKMV